ncbi:glycosyltransferase family 4 protein [Tunturibacter psychrotolerans]|uniref:Glycosyltransferase family 4 protein n=1 Tax=Tunturiibacter psychrotolerans TaxID=3069686 RepID=A0AAU7ZNE4_9BACT
MNTDSDKSDETVDELPAFTTHEISREISVALLTGGGDRPYAFGLATALISKVPTLDLIGSDELDCPEFQNNPGVKFLNLRGNQRPDTSLARKILRVSIYYAKLIRYASSSQPRIFHILWNNKFIFLDRTLLTLYYRLLGKKIAFTVHNVNAGRRDSRDTWLNRLTLRIQYRLVHHIFVHTKKMKLELIEEFGVKPTRVTVIPFGINNAVPNTRLTPSDAKKQLGIRHDKKTVLFFGNIAPYKGLEHLVAAFRLLLGHDENYRLIIAGKPNNCERYWKSIHEDISENVAKGRVILRPEFIPDCETELYFKAADVFVLPYRHIYQSGVLFLGYSFGLPVLAADVGSLKDEIVEGSTGFAFRPEDPVALAVVIEQYFASDLYVDLNVRRRQIREYATERHSWDVVAQTTMKVYADLLRIPFPEKSANCELSNASPDANASS